MIKLFLKNIIHTLIMIPFVGFSQLHVGARGGAVVSSVLLSSKVQVDPADASHADIQKPANTYYGGFVLQLKTGKKFVVRPGFEFVKKGWKVEANDRGRISSFRFLRQYDINYLQVPVNILLTTPLANGKIYLGIGSYIACSLNGTVRVKDNVFDIEFKKVDEPVVTYLPDDNYKPVQYIHHYTINRIDYGTQGLIGYEFNSGLFAETGVDIGIRPISTSQERYDLQKNQTVKDPNSTVRYSSFKLGLGWMIGHSR